MSPGAETPATFTVWRETPGDEANPGYEEPVTIKGVKSGSTSVAVEITVWRDTEPPTPVGDEPTIPDVQTFTVFNITGSSFTLAWGASYSKREFPIQGYTVYLDGQPYGDATSDSGLVEGVVKEAVGSRMALDITGLTSTTIYSVSVAAFNAGGESLQSTPVLVQTASPPTTGVPDPPQNFRATTVGTTNATLAWNASTLPANTPAVTAYRLYANGSQLFREVSASTLSTNLTNLTANTPYAFTVRAVNPNGESAPSSILSIRTLSGVQPLSTPTGFAVSAVGDGFVSLKWNANPDVVDGYYVYRDGVQGPDVTGTSTVVSGLTNGTAYSFYLRAYRGTELSSASPTLTATPQAPTTATKPSAPTGLVSVAGDGQVFLDWANNPTTENVTSYRVYQGTVSVASPTVSQHTVTSLTNNTAYNFSVAAVNAAGEGPKSALVTATPTAAATTTSALPYTSTSFFKSRVDGASVPINATRTTAFRNFMATYVDPDGQSQAAVTWPKININESWAMSYHVHKKGQTAPIWKIKPQAGKSFDSRFNIAMTQGFHMPDTVADTFPTGTQDRPGCMIDYEFGYTIQFADAVPNKATRTIECTGPGIMWHSSNGLDYRNPKSNDNRNMTSRGRILDCMVIRRDLLDEAIAKGTGLGHPLHIFFCETKTTDGYCHPLVGTEGDKNGWGTQGERFRIKPSVDLKARGLTGAALVVAKTLQEHGGYLGDNSGSVTQIKAAQPRYYVGTNIATDALKGKVFWNDMEVIERGWQ